MVGERRRWPVRVLLGVVLLLATVAYLPFQLDPPRPVDNDVTRSPDGGLAFGDHNSARTAGTPSWLTAVRSGQRFQAVLEARPRGEQRHDAISLMMLAPDAWRTDFCLGQDGDDLMLWLRRGGSTLDGTPAYTVEDVFAPGRWTTVAVTVDQRTLRVDVDGRTRVRDRLPRGSLRTWTPGLMVLGDEVSGGRGWRGEIRRAEVTTPAGSVDYASPGALAVPRTYFYLPDHLAPFPPTRRSEWVILALHLGTFLPVGFLLAWSRRPVLRPPPVALYALGIALVLALGKFLFADRHAAVADVVAQVAGATVGAWLARQAEARTPRYASRTASSWSSSAPAPDRTT